MITRAEYLNNECNHRQYYSQFVSKYVKIIVSNLIGVDKLRQSKDPYFNDIPLSLWDMCGKCFNSGTITKQMRSCGDYTTVAGLVCIAKEAARQILEEQKSS